MRTVTGMHPVGMEFWNTGIVEYWVKKQERPIIPSFHYSIAPVYDCSTYLRMLTFIKSPMATIIFTIEEPP